MNIKENFYCSKCMRELEDDDICPFCGYDPAHPVSKKILEEGTLLQNGRYQLGAILGAGGFGITYAAWDFTLNQPVAIKEYFPQMLADRDIWESNDIFTDEDNKTVYILGMQRFSREARVLSTLQNIKNVVTVFDWFEANETAYIVMEYVRGQTIDSYVAEHHTKPKELLAMFRDLIDSLISIHAQGILHRDISPSNIMVEEDGSLKLIDFGASIAEQRRREGLDRTVIFNRSFAPIEQYNENGEQSARTDVYALSATLYYLLTKELPLESLVRSKKDSLKSLHSYHLGLKKWQERAIMEGMAVLPDKRIQSMMHFRSIMYHLPLPEEIKKQRIFIIKASVISAITIIISILLFINATYGFADSNGIYYNLNLNGLHIIGNKTEQAQLIIPSKIFGIPVSKIEDNAFAMNTFLETVTIPGTIKVIDDRAFRECEALHSVTIEDGVEQIGEYAFYCCPSLYSVILPESLRQLPSIPSYIFYGAANQLFVWCKKGSYADTVLSNDGINTAELSDYTIEQNNTGVTLSGKAGYLEPYTKSFSMPVVIDNQPITMLHPDLDCSEIEECVSINLPTYLEILPKGILSDRSYIEAISFGDSLKEISDYACYHTGLKYISLPETVEQIGDYAFSLAQITDISIPSSVKEIGKYAFSYSFLEKASLSKSSIEIISEGMFSGCYTLEKVELPESLKTIDAFAFSECNSLEEIDLPDNLETIGIQAFYCCYSLTEIVLPPNIKQIEHKAFEGCINLQALYVPPSVQDISPYAFDGLKKDFVIFGASGSKIEQYAKQYKITFKAIDETDKYIYGITDKGALLSFWNESNYKVVTELPSVYVSQDLRGKIITSLSYVQSLNCHTVYLPRYARDVEKLAFYNNTYIHEIYGFDDLKEIGSMAFLGCTNLKKISFKEGLQIIDEYAFADNKNLTDVSLPDSIEILGTSTFFGCNFSTIDIPASLTILPESCFAETPLTEVVIPKNIIECLTSFYGCENLSHVIIENGIKTLCGSFANCTSLESISLPASVQQISRSTFQGCTNLKDVYIYSPDVNLDYISYVDHFRFENGSLQILSLEEYIEDNYLFSDSPDLVLHGYKGSTTQIYAAEHDIPFEIIYEIPETDK